MSRIGIARVLLFAISLLMIWEALSPSTFGLFFKRPFKDGVELSYLVALLGSIILVGIAVYQLRHRGNSILRGAMNLLFAISLCLVLLICYILMGVRTGL